MQLETKGWSVKLTLEGQAANRNSKCLSKECTGAKLGQMGTIDSDIHIEVQYKGTIVDLFLLIFR